MGTERYFAGGKFSRPGSVPPKKRLSVPISFPALILLLLAFARCHGKKPDDLFSFRLPSVDGSLVELFSLRSNKATVFAFLAPDCPLSQNYTRTLNNLQDQFRADHFGFYAVISGDLYSEEEIVQFTRQYKINLPVLRDHDFSLADHFGAHVTPEAFVVAPDAQLAYRGAIDNWVGDLGQHRIATTEDYLSDALADIQKGRRVRVRETRPVGCFIEHKILSDNQG